MVTVWCVLNGSKYGPADVYLLRDQVRRHLSAEHEFWCYSDRPIPGVDCVIADEQLPGWWAKLGLFGWARSGLNLYIDLDAVIVGPLDGLISEGFSAPANWAQSGHGGIQSSVMAWGGDYGWIRDAFDASLLTPDPHHPFGRYGATDYWGDQGFLTALIGDPGAGKVTPMPGVCSYKYHCRDRGIPPDWASIVAFHGEPKAADCSESWIRRALSFTQAA